MKKPEHIINTHGYVSDAGMENLLYSAYEQSRAYIDHQENEIASLRARMKDFVRYAANDFVSNRDGKTDEYKKLFDKALAEIRNVEPDFDPFIACIGVRSSQEATAHLINSISTEPTTVLGWLERLPDGYRERAIEQCGYPQGKRDSLPTALIIGFIWRETNEGQDFWHAVHKHYDCGTPLPPLPI
jgi:hypothetical protein